MKEDFKPKTNPIGKKYGRLLVTGFSHKVRRKYYYNCVCDCGREIVKPSDYLFRPHLFPHQSCGCWHKEIMLEHFTTHNMSKTHTYKTWCEIKYRCCVPSCSAYKDYGGRGIKMCDRWVDSYENFLEDMGERPEGTTIDRIDNNGDYCPENCRWADFKTQCNNRRSNIKINYLGESKSLTLWCEQFDMNYHVVKYAWKSGKYTFQEIVDIYKNQGRKVKRNKTK